MAEEKSMQESMSDVKEQIAKVIEAELKKAYIRGINAGFYSGIVRAYANTKDLTSAKAIKEKLRIEVENLEGKFKTQLLHDEKKDNAQV